MDVADVLKFKNEQGQSKYAEAITKAEAHLLKLNEERKLKHQLDEKFKAEIAERQRIQKEIEVKRTLAEQSEKMKQLEKAEALKQEVAKLEAERKASLEQTLERTKQARIERAQEVLQQKQQFLEKEKFLLQEAKIEQLQKELLQTKAELAQQRSENHTLQHGQQVAQEAQLLQRLWNMQAPLIRQDYESVVKGIVSSALKVTLEVFDPTAQDSKARITVDNYQGFCKDLIVRAPEQGWKDAHKEDKNFLRVIFLEVLLTDSAYERYCSRWEAKLVVQQQELHYQEQRQRGHRHGLGY